MLDKEDSPLHTESGRKKAIGNDQRKWSIDKGGDYGCSMDCQHQYVPANPSDHHGFLSHHSGERLDQVAEKRMRFWFYLVSLVPLVCLVNQIRKPKKPERLEKLEKLFDFPIGADGCIF